MRTLYALLAAMLLASLTGCGGKDAEAGTGSAHITPTGQRGRPVLNAAKTTFVADNGELIRGARYTTEWAWGDAALAQSDIDTLKANGLNAIHLYAEAYTGGYTAGSKAAYIDQVVKITRDNSLYLIITIGNGAGNGAFDHDYVMAFWQAYAARYAAETHVIYEIQNEPVAWGPPYSTAALNMEKEAYTLIRAAAPKTPILLFTYSVLGSASEALNDIAALGDAIDWRNAAVGFHGYAGTTTLSTELPKLLAAGYPAFQTEFCMVPWGGGEWEYESGNYIDTDLAGLLERLQVSWTSFVDITHLHDDIIHKTQLDYAGIAWTADFGSWPAARSTYANSGKPWTLADTASTLSIEAENYDAGAAGVSYLDTSSGNGAGKYRKDDVDIAAASDAGNGLYVSDAVAGEYLDYTVYLPTSGYYDLSVRAAVDNSCSLAFTARDVALTGDWALAASSGAWASSSRKVLLGRGQQRLRLAVSAGSCKLDSLSLKVSSSGYLADGTYKVLNANSGLAIGPAGDSMADGVAVVQNAYAGSSTQQWVFTHRGAGQYTVWNAAASNNEKLTVTGDTPANHAPLQIWGEWWWGDTQTFIVQPQDDGSYVLLNTLSGLALQIVGASSEAGAALEQYRRDGSTNQQWQLGAP